MANYNGSINRSKENASGSRRPFPLMMPDGLWQSTSSIKIPSVFTVLSAILLRWINSTAETNECSKNEIKNWKRPESNADSVDGVVKKDPVVVLNPVGRFWMWPNCTFLSEARQMLLNESYVGLARGMARTISPSTRAVIRRESLCISIPMQTIIPLNLFWFLFMLVALASPAL